MTLTFRELFQEIREILKKNKMIQSRQWDQVEAEVILCTILKKTRTQLYSGLNQKAEELLQEKALEIAQERAKGFPLQYLTGSQWFLNHEYFVAPGVLIPRPETECLVMECRQWLQSIQKEFLLGYEIGLGSGCISIELLSYFKNLKMISIEKSEIAHQIASKNTKALLEKESHRLKIIQTAQLFNLKESFDFIISNPPYLDREDEIDEDVRTHEPEEALYPESDPNEFYLKIAKEAKNCLNSEGRVFLEIPDIRSKEIYDIFDSLGYDVCIKKDLTLKDRVLIAEVKNG